MPVRNFAGILFGFYTYYFMVGQGKLKKRIFMSKKIILFFLMLVVLLPAFADRRESYFGGHSFYIEEIDRDDGEISLDFSIPVNPESVVRESILVDGKPLPAQAKFFFNRRGDEMKILELPEWRNKVLCIEIIGLASYDGQRMKGFPAFHLGPDDEVELEDLDELDRCQHHQ